MAENSNSILGFLKMKSLFSNSPTKQLGRRRERSSRSRDSKDLKEGNHRNSLVDLDQPITNQRLLHKNSETDLHRNIDQRKLREYSPTNNIRYGQMSNTVRVGKTDEDFRQLTRVSDSKVNRNPQEQLGKNLESKLGKYSEKQLVKNEPEDMRSNQVWAGLVNHSSSFESARIESAQCLETLSIKLHTEVSNINYKIDMFNSKMTRMLSNEFKNLREKINSIVEDVFKQSQRSIKEYMKIQEQTLAKELIAMREILEKEFVHIETMKEEINKPQWRKVAGELLSSELEHKVEALIKQSNAIDIAHCDIGDLGAGRIKSLEGELREIVKLKS